MVVLPWNEISDLPASAELVRELFPFAEGYRFFPNRYEAGVKFPASIAQPVRLYVFEGECVYRSNAGTFAIRTAEFVDLPQGEYEFEVSPKAPVRLMRVFRIPQADAGPTLAAEGNTRGAGSSL